MLSQIMLLFFQLLSVQVFVGNGFVLPPRGHPPQPNEFKTLHAKTTSTTESWTTDSTLSSSTERQPSYRFYNSTKPPITPKLQSYQTKHAPIASSFRSSTFKPLPLLSNRHLQTIGGVFLRSNPNCAYFRNVLSSLAGIVSSLWNIRQNEYITPMAGNDWYYDRRERIVTPSGGSFFTVDHKYYNSTTTATKSSSRGTVIIVHGLESNSNSSLCIDMSNAFLSKGYDVSVINFRGCCGTDVSSLYEDGTLVRNGENGLMYHLGFVDDLIYYLSLLALRSTSNDSKTPIYLSGFSLGANVILKALGQMGPNTVDLYSISGAAVAGAPFDTERNYLQFHNDPISRRIYVENLLNKLKQRADEILQVYYDGDANAAGFDYQKSMDANTIYELESACVAPLFGFEDHIDYYRKTSCGYFLDGICVPTYVVNAKDDPFFTPEYVPWDKVYGGKSGYDFDGGGAPVKIAFTEEGGHLGYIFHQREEDENEESDKASWISEELARFVDHAHRELFAEDSTAGAGSDSSLPLL